MNSEFKKDIQREIKKQNIGELSPGATGRRYEPNEGTSKLNKRIHKESAYVDKYKNLPFTFSKPNKSSAKPAIKVCSNCKNPVYVNKSTIGVICSECKGYYRVEEVAIEEEK